MLRLNFDPEADLILAYADIKGPKDSEQVRLVVDTGAARTEIDSEILTALASHPFNFDRCLIRIGNISGMIAVAKKRAHAARKQQECGRQNGNHPQHYLADWNIPDPRDMSPDEFREVRDLIEQKV